MRCFSVTPSRNSMAMNALAVLLADFVDRADVGMVQSGSGLSFALEAVQRLRVLWQHRQAGISGRRSDPSRVSSAL